MGNYQVYIRKSGGDWNNDPTADPVTNVGGIDISVMAGTVMFPTVQGGGDGSITCNFGATTFNDPVPAGYTAGWPASGGGFTTLNPDALYGNAGLSGGNLTGHFVSGDGMAQAFDGYAAGQYYFELTFAGGDIFTTKVGGGIGADYAVGGDFNFWFAAAQFNNSNPNGGALFDGGNIGTGFMANLEALGAGIASNVFHYGIGDVVDIAVFLTEGPPPTRTADVADLFLTSTDGFVDMAVESNRRNFISVTGGVRNLGATGELPFQVTPPVYLTRRGVPVTFAVNNGRGGPFGIISLDPVAASLDPPGSSTSLTRLTPPSNGAGVLGDYRNGNLYAFNPATLLDNGSPRRWVRQWRALPQATMKAVSFKWLTVAMQTGILVPPEDNPLLMLRWSDDGGLSWSNQMIVAAGRTGQTVKPIKFNRLGATRRFSGTDRIFELSSTSPFAVAIMDAEVEVS